MKPHEIRGLWLGLLGVAIFALTLPMTRLAVGTPEAPQMSGVFIALGRAVVAAALSGALEGQGVCFSADPVFKILVPDRCPGVPAQLLTPRATWRDGGAYDAKARELAVLFRRNFEQYGAAAPAEVRAAAPADAA